MDPVALQAPHLSGNHQVLSFDLLDALVKTSVLNLTKCLFTSRSRLLWFFVEFTHS